MPLSSNLNKLKQFPFIRLLLFFIVGILCSWYLSFSVLQLSIVTCLLLATLVIFQFITLSNQFRLRHIRGICILLLIGVAGSFLVHLKNITHQSQWYGNISDKSAASLVILDEPLIEKPNSYKAFASVTHVHVNNKWQVATGKIILYFKKDSNLLKTLSYGTELLFKKNIQSIQNSGNPGSFDYKRYSLFHDITGQVYLTPADFLLTGNNECSWLTKTLYNLSDKVRNVLTSYIPNKNEYSVAEALLIGYKNDLDKELLQSYSNTGVIHIIAISGLHLGMIYVLMLGILKTIRSRNKIVNLILILFVLWFFTLLTGAAPSILRSAVMFSFIALGQAFNRRTNIYNTLAASAFCILAVNPFYLWDVGFQLSYLAVFSILLFQKPIYNWLYIENKLLDIAWKLTTVTIAAQILALPVILYYFHQFPNLFLITNFVAIPLSGLILYVELFLIIFSFIPAIADLLGKICSISIKWLNDFILYMDEFRFATTDNIHVDTVATILLYGVILLISAAIWTKRKSIIFITLFTATGFCLYQTVDIINKNQQQKLIIYNIPKQTAIEIVRGDSIYFIGDSAILKDERGMNFHIKPSRIQNRINHQNLSFLHNTYFEVAAKKIIVLSKNISYMHIQDQPLIDYLILSKNARLSILELMDKIKFKQLIADGSNSKWKTAQWKKDCDSLHLHFHSVPDQGAFIMDLPSL